MLSFMLLPQRNCCHCAAVIVRYFLCQMVEMNRCSLLLAMFFFGCKRNRMRHDPKHVVQNTHLTFQHSNFHSQSYSRHQYGWHITNSQMQFPAMPSKMNAATNERNAFATRQIFFWACDEKMPRMSTALIFESREFVWIIGLIEYFWECCSLYQLAAFYYLSGGMQRICKEPYHKW